MVAVVLLIWALAVGAGSIIGSYKGRQGLGIGLAAILAWVGVLILAFIPPTHERLVEKAARRQAIEEEARRLRGKGDAP